MFTFQFFFFFNARKIFKLIPLFAKILAMNIEQKEFVNELKMVLLDFFENWLSFAH